MNRWIPMVLLTAGLGLAAASGARNGEAHQAWRQASWAAKQAEADPSASPPAPPPPRQRLAEWAGVGGVGWGAGIALILVGAVLARRQSAEAFAGGGEGVGAVDFPGTLARLRVELEALASDLSGVAMDETAPGLRARLDDLRIGLIEPVVDGRGQLIARHGIARFAEYFSPFSAGERNLNRCWSALTDGHAVVARDALTKAQAELDEAAKAWARVNGEPG
jgi:hypothetical protein